jgi:hypothetical protein
LRPLQRAAEDDIISLVDGLMNANSATKPRMMPIKNLAKNGPVGVLKRCCITMSERTGRRTKILRSLARAYDSVGNTLDYVYEMDGDTLTIWGGERGSPAFFRCTFSKDGNKSTGEWVYPGGGGYKSTMTRIRMSAPQNDRSCRATSGIDWSTVKNVDFRLGRSEV